MLQKRQFSCPICGWSGLTANPYKNMPPLAQLPKLMPPYSKHWGLGSNEICSCCGFEFGNSDEGLYPENNYSFESYLFEWYHQEKARWDVPTERPENWSLRQQMESAGLVVPGFVEF